MAEPIGLVVAGLWAVSARKKARARAMRDAVEREAAAEAVAEAEAAAERAAEKAQRRAELESVEDATVDAVRSVCAHHGLSGAGGKLKLVGRLKAGLGWNDARVRRESELEQVMLDAAAEEAAEEGEAAAAAAAAELGGGGCAAEACPDDLYAVLGVNSCAQPKAIRRAYQRLALQHHPDKNPAADAAAATRRFQAVGRAYEVLADPEARALYDADPKGFWAQDGVEARWSDGDAVDARMAATFMRECLSQMLAEVQAQNPLMGLLFAGVMPLYSQLLEQGLEESLAIWNSLSRAQRREIIGLALSLLADG
jgi:DnaJ-domain-containing protein 1